MAATNSYNSFDFQNGITVPVIASFNKVGEIRPLYIRINGYPLKITSFWVKSRFVNTMEFNCTVIDHGQERIMKITYYQAEGVWVMFPQ